MVLLIIWHKNWYVLVSELQFKKKLAAASAELSDTQLQVSSGGE
jgi:hypothetical protein